MTAVAYNHLSDRDLERRVYAFLASSPVAALREVSVRASQGVVVLRGRMPSFHSKQIAQARAARVAGVWQVINQLHVDFEGTQRGSRKTVSIQRTPRPGVQGSQPSLAAGSSLAIQAGSSRHVALLANALSLRGDHEKPNYQVSRDDT